VRLTQSKIIEAMLLTCIEDKNMTDKNKIMELVVKELEVPKPTVRRVKLNTIKKYQNYIKILSGKNEI